MRERESREKAERKQREREREREIEREIENRRSCYRAGQTDWQAGGQTDVGGAFT